MRDSVGFAMKVLPSEHGDWVVSNSNPAATVATLVRGIVDIGLFAETKGVQQTRKERTPHWAADRS